MNTPARIVTVVAVALAVVGAVVLKQRRAPAADQSTAPGLAARKTPAAGPGDEAAAGAAAKLPKLIDLGADKCVPCKAMAPILDALKKEYAGRMDVEFIDVWKNPDAGKRYDIEMIPTQIFLDANGKERFRHTGFLGKEDILGKWKELGVNLGDSQAPAAKP
jgi:thioredoxin 1